MEKKEDQKYNNINYKQIDKTMKNKNKNIKIKKTTTTNKENVISRERKDNVQEKEKKKYNTWNIIIKR